MKKSNFLKTARAQNSASNKKTTPVHVIKHVKDVKSLNNISKHPLKISAPFILPSKLPTPTKSASINRIAKTVPKKSSSEQNVLATTKSTATRTSLVDRQTGPSSAALLRRKQAEAKALKPKPKPTTSTIATTRSKKEHQVPRKHISKRSRATSPTKKKVARETQPPGTTQTDTVRDLQERLLMAQTQVIQWLFVSSKLERTASKQTESGQRQIYAVWRATEQAHQRVASLETLLVNAKISQGRKKSLLNESRALRELGAATTAIMDESSCNTREMEYNNRRQVVESKTHKAHQEYKQFATDISSSRSWIPVTNMKAIESSQNGNLDLAMEQLAQTTSILEAALSNELSSAVSKSKEWEKLANTLESSANLLAGSTEEVTVTQNHVDTSTITKDNHMHSMDSSGLLANAFNRTSRAINSMH
jgi:hypothetical protein